ncbi:MAG: serine/threonine-protein kinase [Verrucomicrobiales bacterium]
MPDETPAPVVNACPECGDVLDVSDFQPFAKIICPHCRQAIRVRTVFNQFVIKRQIGEGGMSRVFLAEDTTLHREVALKILHRDLCENRERIAQFEREAQITAKISHPHVIQIYSVGQDQGYFFIAMELVSGGSLDDWIRREGKVREDRALDLAIQVVGGMRAAHNAGLIHRDMKPGNILFNEMGDAKIVDFGLAMFKDDSDGTGEIWATPFYVPPETLYHKPEDHRSDMYALGASLFHALAGRPPHSAADTSSLAELKRVKAQPVRLSEAAPHISPATAEVIDKMCAQEQRDRYEEWEDLEAALRTARQLRRRGWREIAREKMQTRRGQAQLAAGAGALTVAAALAIYAGFAVYQSIQDKKNRDQEGTGKVDVAEQTQGGLNTSEIFLAGRAALVSGQVDAARGHFAKILNRQNQVKQPTLNWTRFNAALCAQLSGDAAGAQALYSALAGSPPYSSAPSDRPLAEFFIKAGAALAKPGADPSFALAQFSPDSFEAMGLLGCGLRCWNDSRWAEAGELLRAFQSGKPAPPFDWVAQYHALAPDLLHDIAIAESIASPASEESAADLRPKVEAADAAIAEVKTGDRARARIMVKVDALHAALSAAEQREAKMEEDRLAELLKREAADLAAAKEKVAPLAATYQFAKAVPDLEALALKHPKAAQARDDMIYLWQGASAFLDLLAEDLTRVGFTGNIPKDGSEVPVSIASATPEEVTMQRGTGTSKVPMTQVGAEGLIAIADSILSKVQDSAEYFRRREAAIAFASLAGQRKAAESMAAQLMPELRDFRARWKRMHP